MSRINDILESELIGLEVKVEKAMNRAYCGIRGKVVNETKNMLAVETQSGTKQVIKDACTFMFYREGRAILVEGRLLQRRPEERIKPR